MTPVSVRCQPGKNSQRLIHLTLGITHASLAYILLTEKSHRTNLRLNLAGNYTELLLRVSVTVLCTAKLLRGCLGAEGYTGSGKPLIRASSALGKQARMTHDVSLHRKWRETPVRNTSAQVRWEEKFPPRHACRSPWLLWVFRALSPNQSR